MRDNASGTVPEAQHHGMPIQRSSRLDLAAVDEFIGGWCERFGSSSAFLRILGRPMFSMLNVSDFAAVYTLEGLGVLTAYIRSRIAARLGTEPFMVGVLAAANLYNVQVANRLPLDGVTGYGMLPDWQGPPIQDYAELIAKRVREWYTIQAHLTMPFLPVVCAGWDATVRGELAHDLRAVKGFPWRPVVTGVTAPLFGAFLDQALEFNAKCHPEMNVVFLHAWNEWTESSAIEPSDKFGADFLEEVRKRAAALQG